MGQTCCLNAPQNIWYCDGGLTCDQNKVCRLSGSLETCNTPGATCCSNQGQFFCLNGLTCDQNKTCRTTGGGPAGPTDGIVLTNPLGVTTIDEAILKVLNILKTVGAPIAVVMVIVGGFQMLFAAGDPEKFKSGQKTILYSAIGYAIIFLADGIATLIQNALS